MKEYIMNKKYYWIIGIILLIVGIIALFSQFCAIALMYITGRGSPISCLFYTGYDEDFTYKLYNWLGMILFLFSTIAGIVLIYRGFKKK
jgi:uncharacterized membrane protein HdeD (DUF308 family)